MGEGNINYRLFFNSNITIWNCIFWYHYQFTTLQIILNATIDFILSTKRFEGALLKRNNQPKLNRLSQVYYLLLRKPVRNAYLGIVKHDRTSRANRKPREPIGNLFYLLAAIFEIPKYCFMIKPPACCGADVSIEIYELLLLFSIISAQGN